MLKAVLMDIDDTLLDFGKCAEQAMRIGFAEWGLPYDDSTYATFTRINDGLWLMIEQQLNRLEMAGLLPYFDHVFVSESLGYRKPEKAFFDACRAFLPDVAADECMMIGDSLTADITGGKNAGMKTIWYNHTHRPVPERCEADQIVDSLLKLKNLL